MVIESYSKRERIPHIQKFPHQSQKPHKMASLDLMKTTDNPFRSEVPDECDFAAILLRNGNPSGFIEVRKTSITQESGFLLSKARSTRNVLRWRVRLSPVEPWDEGYAEMDDGLVELRNNLFAYRGITYQTAWVGDPWVKWISLCCLGD